MVTNHNEKFVLYPIECDPKLASNENFSTHIKTEYIINKRVIKLKRYFSCWIEYFFLKGYKFSHLTEMNIKTNYKRYMKYKHYIKQPMQTVEMKLNKIIAQNPHLTESLDGIIINPLNKKYSIMLFNVQ